MDPATYGVKDASLIKTKALPAAGASASTAGLDLGALTGRGARLESFEFLLELPATPNLADAKSIDIDIETDDNSGFSSAAKLIKDAILVTGAGGAGAAAASYRFKVPTNAERYLRATASVEAAGGDNTAVSFTLTALF